MSFWSKLVTLDGVPPFSLPARTFEVLELVKPVLDPTKSKPAMPRWFLRQWQVPSKFLNLFWLFTIYINLSSNAFNLANNWYYVFEIRPPACGSNQSK